MLYLVIAGVALVALWAVVAIVRIRSRPEVQRLKLLRKILRGATFSERERLLGYLLDAQSREDTPQEAAERLTRIFGEGRRLGLLKDD